MNRHRRRRATLLGTLGLAALATSAPAQTRTGVDVLAATDCAQLRDRRIGLVTNHTGRTHDGRRTVDVLHAAAGVRLVALFSPEHGWNGAADAAVASGKDAATGLPVHSLYGETRRPTAGMLEGIDTLVFDVQDIGCRFYTYHSTMRNCLEAAAAHKLRFVVLDRPNPIGGVRMEGPVLDGSRLDFTGAHRIPVRHGLSTGELARMIVGEDGLQIDLEVVRCTGWQRADTFERTGLPWTAPSPNMRRLQQALLYPGIGLLEGTNVSVGRGTDTPFELLGAPWCDGVALSEHLRAAALPGVGFVPIEFTPVASVWQGERCRGVHIVITDWQTFEPVRTGIHVASALRALHHDAWDPQRLDWLLKHAPSCRAILDGTAADRIVATWQRDLDLFRMRRQPFLLYE